MEREELEELTLAKLREQEAEMRDADAAWTTEDEVDAPPPLPDDEPLSLAEMRDADAAWTTEDEVDAPPPLPDDEPVSLVEEERTTEERTEAGEELAQQDAAREEVGGFVHSGIFPRRNLPASSDAFFLSSSGPPELVVSCPLHGVI